MEDLAPREGPSPVRLHEPNFSESLQPTQSSLPPTLPQEIWRKIISFTVRTSIRPRINLEDHLYLSHKDEADYGDGGLFLDRKRLSQVSSSWRAIVAEISAESLTIETKVALDSIIKTFKDSKMDPGRAGPPLGEWARQVEVQMVHVWSSDVDAHIHFFQYTPNLVIYSNDEASMIRDTSEASREILRALILQCGHSLRRIDWCFRWQSFTYDTIVELCNACPNLITLRMACYWAHSDPTINDAPSWLYIPKLETLSLRTGINVTWAFFLRRMLFSSEQLPCLQSFDCDRLPPNAPTFFQVHGHKIRHFRTSLFHESHMSEVIRSCPNLESLTIENCRKDSEFPMAHPTLERICIWSSAEEEADTRSVPLPSLDHILRSIESMDAPRHNKVRLYINGPSYSIFYNCKWLRSWWRRLNIRGIRLVDETGASFENLYNSEEDRCDSD